jgi:uncharacterized sulfatase
VCEVPAGTTDLPPTFLDLAGIDAPMKDPLDGVSLVPLLKDSEADPARDTLFWHLPHYHHGTPASAIRRGDWKLLEFFETGALELYDLSADLGETNNLAAKHPDKTTELRDVLAIWRKEVGARMPTSNPEHDPSRADELGGGKGKREKKR